MSPIDNLAELLGADRVTRWEGYYLVWASPGDDDPWLVMDEANARRVAQDPARYRISNGRQA